MKSLVSAILLSSAIGVGTVLAQTSAPAPTGQPATGVVGNTSEFQAIRSVILITATTLPSLKACSFVFRVATY